MSNLRRTAGILLEIGGLLLVLGSTCGFPPSLIGKQQYTGQDFLLTLVGLALGVIGGRLFHRRPQPEVGDPQPSNPARRTP